MDWIAFILEEENEALQQIYLQNKGFCISFMMKKFDITLEDSLDIFQNSVVILYDRVITGHLKEYQGDIQPYLLKIVDNKAKEFKRSQYRRIQENQNYYIAEDFRYNESDEELNREEHFSIKSEILKNALRQLGVHCKNLLELYYFKKLSADKIVQQLKYSNKDSLKTNKYKCMKRLKKLYHQMYADEYKA